MTPESRAILQAANSGLPRGDFLTVVAAILSNACNCDSVSLRMQQGGSVWRCWKAVRDGRTELDVTRVAESKSPSSDLESLLDAALRGSAGELRVDDAHQPFTAIIDNEKRTFQLGGSDRSLAIFPLAVSDSSSAVMTLGKRHPAAFSKQLLERIRVIAGTLTIGLRSQESQAALGERVKELTCLYGINRLTTDVTASVEEIVTDVVALLPPAWQYPECAFARIELDGHTHATASETAEPGGRQRANIVVGGKPRGFVEVAYTEDKPVLDEGPFLKEERSLLNAIARNLAMFLEAQQMEEQRTRLQEQLRHADRLATIGQLAAGVTHEVNEPLASILGFAQLIDKAPDLPAQIKQDTSRIIDSALFAREIVRKLMLFARQTPPAYAPVDLNEIVNEGLFFLESRCAKEGIVLRRSLAEDLPAVNGDPGQLTQALVNLVVNSIQATPGGGVIRVSTQHDNDHVELGVTDSGTGMSEDVLSQVFVPFFTTKNVDKGTGLGLAVVAGIVEGHDGTVDVESEPGCGTTFTIRLPGAASSEQQQ